MGQIQSDEDEEVRLADIQPLYIVFMRECPSGALHLHEFRKIFGIQSTSEDEALFIETIFKSFDTNKDDVIDFMEFVAAVHLVLRGKLEDRLRWFFKVYDRDENGKLDKQEVKHIIKIICQLKRKTLEMTHHEICDRIFELIDENKDVNASGSVMVSLRECEGQVTGRYYSKILCGRQLTRGQTATGDADFG
ncbi:Guanylyl cyclase-activating protein 2 [Triplophysa tibetana]|uniref:Guanylyl cyclase-activating protein 2 n=1 Tax=Triplophysa tibetana TaxID=1572043 RepID=A0A5A9PU44_9TELE|nr:Guanylyl cyclase-activating protein 2 [Triplophysa tibetana]